MEVKEIEYQYHYELVQQICRLESSLKLIAASLPEAAPEGLESLPWAKDSLVIIAGELARVSESLVEMHLAPSVS